MKNKEIFTLYRYVRILLMHWGLDCYMWQIDREIERDRKWNQKTRDHENLNILKKWSSRSSFNFSTKNLVKISFREQCALSSSFKLASSSLEIQPSWRRGRQSTRDIASRVLQEFRRPYVARHILWKAAFLLATISIATRSNVFALWYINKRNFCKFHI